MSDSIEEKIEITVEQAERWIEKFLLVKSRGARLVMVKQLLSIQHKKTIQECERVIENTTPIWKKPSFKNAYEAQEAYRSDLHTALQKLKEGK